MKRSKATLAEFEITNGDTVEIRLFGKHLTDHMVRTMLIICGFPRTITVKKLETKS